MRRKTQICIAILLAVLTIGTAFADRSTNFNKPLCPDEMLLSYIRNTIVTPYMQEGECAPQNYPQLMNQFDRLNAYALTLSNNIQKIDQRLKALSVGNDGDKKVIVLCSLSLDWKMLGTLLFTYGSRMTDVLKQNLFLHIGITEDVIIVKIGFSGFDRLLWLDNETDWFAARNTYYYLNTVYADDGTKREQRTYAMPHDKLDAMAFPLDAKWYENIKTTWFRSRDRGTRVHTGMDVRCTQGSPVYACAGGKVISVGYHIKGGYYVSVMDDDGYEYFYYHLKKQSQCVVRGQTIQTGERLGLSGNTGNSAAPHLHLSIITPERCYVDPYPIYRLWIDRHTGNR